MICVVSCCLYHQNKICFVLYDVVLIMTINIVLNSFGKVFLIDFFAMLCRSGKTDTNSRKYKFILSQCFRDMLS